MKKVGITTTVPVEILLAAGYMPIDLNNIFISDQNPHRLVEIAERFGFPQNCCVWIKGIFGVCIDNNIDTVLCVTTGDCSNTIMLMEIGVITPPLGTNVYVVKGAAGDAVSLEKVFSGILPYFLAYLVSVAIIVAFPQIALFLPGLMD